MYRMSTENNKYIHIAPKDKGTSSDVPGGLTWEGINNTYIVLLHKCNELLMMRVYVSSVVL